jgi:hypothetical protein
MLISGVGRINSGNRLPPKTRQALYKVAPLPLLGAGSRMLTPLNYRSMASRLQTILEKL